MTVCLVLGGAGFIGSHLVDALVAQGHVVRVFDNFRSGSLENLEKSRSRIELIHADIMDAATLRTSCQGVELVFHQAGLETAYVGDSDPLALHQTSVIGTLQVLMAAHEAGVRRVIYAGSASAYGDLNRLPRRESDPTNPLSPAAAARLAGEQYCAAFTRLSGLDTIRLRYFNVYGPRQSEGVHKAVIPLLLKHMLEGRNPVLYGDGLQSRDFTYIEDVVQANLLAAEVARGAGKVYNVATGRRTSYLELIQHANALLDTNIPPVQALAPPGYLRHSEADITLAQADLGYCPCFDAKQGVEECIKSMRAQD